MFIQRILFHSPWLYRSVRVVLGGVFVIAGAGKLMDPRAFARLISAYGLLPEELLVPVAIGLPIIEVLAGAGLLLDVRCSHKVIFALLAGFLIILGYAILNEMDIDCGCFSTEEIHQQNSLHQAFVRDLLMLAASFYLLYRQRFQSRFEAAYSCQRIKEEGV